MAYSKFKEPIKKEPKYMLPYVEMAKLYLIAASYKFLSIYAAQENSQNLTKILCLKHLLLVPKDMHIQSKAETFTVEGYNSYQKQYLLKLHS
jgi:hypothetical protein